jgi:hypothetical protein
MRGIRPDSGMPCWPRAHTPLSKKYCRSTHRAAGSPAQGLASRSFDSRTSAHVWIRKHLGWRSVTRAIGYEDAAMRSVGRGGCRRYGRANVTRYVTKHSLTGIQRVGVHGFSEDLAPQPGLEPGTHRLTVAARCSYPESYRASWCRRSRLEIAICRDPLVVPNDTDCLREGVQFWVHSVLGSSALSRHLFIARSVSIARSCWHCAGGSSRRCTTAASPWLGSDAPQSWNVSGFSALRELGALVAAELTRYEALKRGTANVGLYFGTQSTTTRADLIPA